MMRKRFVFSKFFLVFLLAGVFGNVDCHAQAESQDLRACDLLFVTSQKSALSEAIDAVTQTGNEHHFIHIGMIALSKDGFTVLHADSDGGVQEEAMQSFVASQGDVHVYRVKELIPKFADSAIVEARKHIGEPYNFSYILTDSGYYCSEYIYEIFEHEQVFELNPMTFKNPETDDFHPTWVEHYNDLGIEIPEGELGCNPNGMASSSRLEYLGALISKD